MIHSNASGNNVSPYIYQIVLTLTWNYQFFVNIEITISQFSVLKQKWSCSKYLVKNTGKIYNFFSFRLIKQSYHLLQILSSISSLLLEKNPYILKGIDEFIFIYCFHIWIKLKQRKYIYRFLLCLRMSCLQLTYFLFSRIRFKLAQMKLHTKMASVVENNKYLFPT